MPKRAPSMALDCEATGRDFYHGTLPFFVSTCDTEGTTRFWEWEVDPLTRIPEIPRADVEEILALIRVSPEVIFQNAKFDITGLCALSRHVGIPVDGWLKSLWAKTHDTLVTAHLLYSNMPKNLTALAMQYLKEDIEPAELRLDKVCVEARRFVKKKDFRARFGDWAVAEESRPDMPSAGEKLYKADMWLPRAVAKAMSKVAPVDFPPEDSEAPHPWFTAVHEYGNTDPVVTLRVWQAQSALLTNRNLWKIYNWRRKIPPVVHEIERTGPTMLPKEISGLRAEFDEESRSLGATCLNIARDYGYELTLPKNGVNQSLRAFCFEKLRLEPVYNPKAKTDAPTLDSKHAIPHYMATLEENSKPRAFIETLVKKRGCDTAIGFIDGYQRFAIPEKIKLNSGKVITVWRLHPNLNMVGTDTLRFSSDNPNSQSISRKEDFNVRKGFGPTPDEEWWSLDGKNLELRLPTFEAKEEDMMALFLDPDAPPYYGSVHLLNFHTVYPDIWETVEREVGQDRVGPTCKKRFESTWYKWCKNGDFAIQYSAGQDTADRAFHRQGAHATLKARFNKLEALNQWCLRFANEHGYIETMPDKTVDPDRGYPLLIERSQWAKVVPTKPLNYRIQGTAMWWTCAAMVRCQPQLDEWNRQAGRQDYRMIFQVHDELVFRFPRAAHPLKDPKRSNLARAKVLQRLMEQGGDNINIPTPVGLEYHPDNWGVGLAV